MNSESRIIRVKHVMKTGMDIVDGMQTVAEVVDTLKYPENRAIIIDKRHDDDEYGIVMFRDIAREVMASGRAPHRVNIYEIMSKPVISVEPDMNIRYCIRLFVQFGLSRAPVIEDRKIVGLVSYTDIVLKGMKLLQQ
jgi:signal-transduction protein with cAMP-binding, CBS, and nucleotidyltransferase domain